MSDQELQPVPARGVNHLVLNVRDIEASHRFYTDGLGWKQIGSLRPESGMDMRFYQCRPGSHHDLALIQMGDPAAAGPPANWRLGGGKSVAAINHFAVAYAPEDFTRQLAYMQAKGVDFKIRGEHGMTHSCYVVDPDGNGIEILYELPSEIWEQDIDGALNYFKVTPAQGPEALVDNTDYKVFPAPVD